ncbi:hypothetical protein GCM10027615_00920 [Plantactinospora veratri]
MQGSHHSAQKSMTTGVLRERSSTSDWNVASVTSITATPPPPPGGVLGGVPPGVPGPPGGVAAAAGCAGVCAARSAPRSTAPRVKIDEVIRGSLMVP